MCTHSPCQGDQFSLYALYVKSQQKLEAMFTTQRVHSKVGCQCPMGPMLLGNRLSQSLGLHMS